MTFWDTYTLTDGAHYRAAMGPLTLWLRRVGDELHVATVRETDEAAKQRYEPPVEAEPEEPDALKWDRYILSAKSEKVRLFPQMPDRSLVARPESTVELPPGRKATFYVSIPVWVGIEEAVKKPVTLVEVPTVVLSNIWFGDPMSGELCYSLVTRARRAVAETDREPHRAVCVFEVGNDSEESLKVQRLRVHGPSLTIYEDGDRLWTNRTVARFQDRDRGSEVEVLRRPPESGMKRRTEAREAVRGSVFTRVFGVFRREEPFEG